jgi:type I restriction enzyme S subunit
VIADLKPYSEYKESGLPWLGQVPGHWDTRRLRHVCDMRVSNVDKHTKAGETSVRLCNYVDVYKNEQIRGSTRFMAATASEDERVRFGLRKGDVLITKDSEEWNDIGVPALVEYEAPDLVCGYHLAILRARPGLHGAFLHRAIESHFIAAQFHVEANGVTRYGLSHGAIQGVAIPLPPPAEQAAIVRFLDWANGRLERAIRAKRKVIALLNEQKQAIIHRAVTRGLDPSVPLKPSGIPWLGDIPQHWEVQRLSRVARFASGKAHEQFFEPTGVHVCVTARFVSTGGTSRKFSSMNFCPAVRGDVLMVMSDLPNGRALARAYLVGDDKSYAVNQRVCRLTPHAIEPRLLAYYANRSPHLLRHDDGLNQTHLSNYDFKTMPTRREGLVLQSSTRF